MPDAGLDTGSTGVASFFVCTGVTFFRVFFTSVAIASEAGALTAEAAGFVAGADGEVFAAVVLRARFGAGVAAGSAFGAFPVGFATFFSFAGVAGEGDAVSRAFFGARVVLPAVFVFARVRLAVGSEAVSGDRCCCSLSTEVIVSNFHT